MPCQICREDVDPEWYRFYVCLVLTSPFFLGNKHSNIEFIYSILEFMGRRTLDYHERQLIECVREKTQKNETITPTKLSNICGMDFRTVKKHLPNIVDKNLGDGTKIISRDVCVCRTEYERDPPGEPPGGRFHSALRLGVLAICGIFAIASMRRTFVPIANRSIPRPCSAS